MMAPTAKFLKGIFLFFGSTRPFSRMLGGADFARGACRAIICLFYFVFGRFVSSFRPFVLGRFGARQRVFNHQFLSQGTQSFSTHKDR